MGRLSTASLQDLRARNPVPEVASRLGLPLRRSGRSLVGPCPFCGGHDRTAQRFEVDREDSFVCAVCLEAGDCIALVEKVLGVSFREAVDWLGGAAVETDPAEAERRARDIAAKRAVREAEAEGYREAERERLWARWTRMDPYRHAAVDQYLRGRGIDTQALLRLDPAAPYMHGQVMDEHGRSGPCVLHRGPAMVAPILRPDGYFGGLHFTWIDPARPGRKMTIADPTTGEVLPAKKVRGSKRAGRIELIRCPAPTRLVLGEGIETVLSVAEAERRPAGTAYWSAVDLGNLGGPAFETVPHPTEKHANHHRKRVPGPQPDWEQPALPLPDSVTELVLLGDGDSDRFLTECALARAAARHARPGRDIRIAMAPDGKDWNDVLREAMAREGVLEAAE